MSKKELAKAIINLEYTTEQLENINGLKKVRFTDLMRENKEFLERRLKHLTK